MSAKAYLELEDAKSSKFWECVLRGDTTTVRFGKIGASGQSSAKTHASAAAARKFFDKQVAAKKKKGYAEADGGDEDEDEDDDDDDESDDEAQAQPPAKKAKKADEPSGVPLRCSLETEQQAFGIYADDEVVLVGDESGMVVVAKPGKNHTVTVERKIRLPQAVKAVTKDGPFIYAGTDAGEIYDLSSEPRLLAQIEDFGQILWLDFYEGAVAVGSARGNLALVNGEGEIVWRVDSSEWGGDPSQGKPSYAWQVRIDANGVYVGHSVGVAKYSLDGKLKWKNTDIRGVQFGNQTDKFLFSTGSGKSAKIDKKSGKTVVEFDGVHGPSCAANADGSRFVCVGKIFECARAGKPSLLVDYGWQMVRGMSATICGETLYIVNGGLSIFDISAAGIKAGNSKPVKKVTLGKKAVTGVSSTCDTIDVASAASGGVIVKCVKEGSKVRVRVESAGFDSNKNVQFPRALREDGARFVVDSVVESKAGDFYRAIGNPRKIE